MNDPNEVEFFLALGEFVVDASRERVPVLPAEVEFPLSEDVCKLFWCVDEND